MTGALSSFTRLIKNLSNIGSTESKNGDEFEKVHGNETIEIATSYDPEKYWERRLTRHFDLRAVGHISYSQRYNAWLYKRKQTVIASFFKNFALDNCHVLDIGCGTGFFVSFYSKRRANVTGIDITDASVNELRKRFVGPFLKLDISDPSFCPPGRFDIVNIWDVLYHIPEDAAFERAIDNIARSMSPGGLLLLTDYLANKSDIPIASHVKGRCLQTYVDLLSRQGFTLVRIRPLYRALDTGHFGLIDNYLGPIYFMLDSFEKNLAPNHLCFSAWRYKNDPNVAESR